VDVDADVAVLAQSRRAGVEADSNAHGRRPVVPAERPLRRDSRLGRRLRRPEGCKELIAARVDLVTLAIRDRLSQQAAEVAEHRQPLVAELARQARRAFDVREEERHRAGGKRAHSSSLRRV
jgi:hypothetical protein